MKTLPLAVILFVWLAPTSAQAQPPDYTIPTSVIVSLADLRAVKQNLFEGDVAIENTGPNDAMLNLGTVINTRHSIANKLVLKAQGAPGQDFEAGVLAPYAVFGPTQPMLVPLPYKGIYFVHLKWWADTAFESGQYEFCVEFEGETVESAATNPTGGLRYWVGIARSNSISLRIP